MGEWTTDSNEALRLRFVRAGVDSDALSTEEDKLVDDFHPKFTYPIFGEEEKIYGYEDLVINLHMASGSLRQFATVTSSARLTGTAIDDPENTLHQYLPDDRMKDKIPFLKQVEEDAVKFKPMGEKIYSYVRRAGSSKGKTTDPRERPVRSTSRDDKGLKEDDPDVVVYEVYHANWDTPGFREFHRRMQIFILLYIEAGSYIEEDEDKWEFVVLFERRRRKDGTHVYHFIGYSSLYPFYFFPESTRLRLSQFVIAGPYQQQGHGAALYSAIHQFVISSPKYAELTVEDPSEDFEDLRDKVDLRMLLAHKEFIREAYSADSSKKWLSAKPKTKGSNGASKAADGAAPDDKAATKTSKQAMLGPPTKAKWAERWRKELKFAKRQYDRLIEMLILRALDPSDEASQRAFRLQVKARIKTFNFETLMQLDQEEQYDKLEETFQSVKEGYERILGLLKVRPTGPRGNRRQRYYGGGTGQVSTTMSSNRPLWVSVQRNANDFNSGTPTITSGIAQWTLPSQKCWPEKSVVSGLSMLPEEVVQRIFLLAGDDSSYTRWSLTRVCGAWRRLSMNMPELWSHLRTSSASAFYDDAAVKWIQPAALNDRSAHVSLRSPTSTQLCDLLSFAPTRTWVSLTIHLSPKKEVATSMIESLFTGSTFPNLRFLRVEEELSDSLGDDPYSTIYDAIFLSATELRSVSVDSDLQSVAQNYGLFGQQIASIGGSPLYLRQALPMVSDPNAYSHITSLMITRWSQDLARELNLPRLLHLQVDHCHYQLDPRGQRVEPTLILPTLIGLKLTNHSLPVLPFICAATLESLVVAHDSRRFDGCLHPKISDRVGWEYDMAADVWSCPSIESVDIQVHIEIEDLMGFLQYTKDLKTLKLAVPDSAPWRERFVREMNAGHSSVEPDRCVQLESLTLIMDWPYREQEWIEEIRSLFERRSKIRSIIGRWTRDNREAESGPAGDFSMFVGESYGGVSDPGPAEMVEAKQLEAPKKTRNDGEDEEERARDSSEEEGQPPASDDDTWDEEDDEDDIFGSYDDLQFIGQC